MRVPVSLQWLGPGPRHQNPREIGQLFDNQWAQSPRKSSEGHFCGDPKPKQQRPIGRQFLAVVQYVNPGSDPSGNEQCGGDRSHLASSITLLTIWPARRPAVSMSSLKMVTISPSKEQNKPEKTKERWNDINRDLLALHACFPKQGGNIQEFGSPPS